jgi:hypothetical protein
MMALTAAVTLAGTLVLTGCSQSSDSSPANVTNASNASTSETISPAQVTEYGQRAFNNYVSNYAWMMDNVNNRLLADAERIARSPFFASGQPNAEAALEMFNLIKNENFAYDDVYYTLADGKYVGLDPEADPTFDWTQRPWYGATQTKNGPAVTGFYDSMTGDKAQDMTFSYPVKDAAGQFLGVAAVDLTVPAWTDLLLPADSGNDFIDDIVLISPDGEPLATLAGDGSEDDTIRQSAAEYATAATSPGPIVNLPNQDGNRYRSVITTTATTDWGVVIFGQVENYGGTNPTLEGVKNQFDLDALDQMKFEIDSTVTYIKNDIERLANNISRIGVDQFIQANSLATASTTTWKYDDAYLTLEADGKYVGLDPAADQSIDYRTRIWYTKAKDAGRAVTTDFYQSVTGSQQKSMAFAAPFNDGTGEFAGVVSYDMTTTTAKSQLYNGDSSLTAMLVLVGD